MELRPLGFGEIFDRAITLYVRNFVPFAGIVCVLVVPLAVLQYFLDVSSLPQWDQSIKILEHPTTSAGSAPMPVYFTSPTAGALLILTILLVYAVWPFALNACTVGVARLYRGRPVEFVPCYRAALRHWPRVLGLLLIEAGIFVAWYVALFFGALVAVFLTIALARVLVPVAVLAGILEIALGIAWLLFLAPLFVALTFAMNAIVVEERDVFTAVGLGFSRVFNRQEFWRAVLFSFASVAILMGASMLTGAIAIAAMMVHWVVLEVVVATIFRAAFTPFSIVLLAIYYFDVRIRREGYDLEAGLERLTSDTAVA
ncbi:MAG TPA: hypothetical protein VMH02_05510 [Verrucomicrobiae bacterium]|nr:hypothetical protein [Verrucomicrobiae bacterium]